MLELWGKPLIRDTIVPLEGIWLLPAFAFFVLEEETGKGLGLFRAGDQLLPWVGPGWGF